MAGGQGVLGVEAGGLEAGGVGGGLGAELGEIEVGAGAVAHVHGLVEAALGVVAVEDDAVEQDADDVDDDLDDHADEGPVLEAADEGVVDLFAKDLGALVLFARPAPHVLAATVAAARLEEAGGDGPHDHREDEPADSEEGVVGCYLLGTLVAAAAIGEEDTDADSKGDGRHCGHC